MTGSSQQLRLFRRARRDGDTLMTACVKSGIPLAEARLWDAEDRRNPPSEECFQLLNTAGASPAKPEEDEMGRPKKVTAINGELPKPDFDHADEIYTADIAPANAAQKRAMKDASDGWKAVKKDARVHVGGYRKAMDVARMEEAEQQAWLRSFNGGLKQKGVALIADLVDQAQTGAAAGADPVPVTTERPKPTLVTINHPDDDSDLNPPDPEPAAETDTDEPEQQAAE